MSLTPNLFISSCISPIILLGADGPSIIRGVYICTRSAPFLILSMASVPVLTPPELTTIRFLYLSSFLRAWRILFWRVGSESWTIKPSKL